MKSLSIGLLDSMFTLSDPNERFSLIFFLLVKCRCFFVCRKHFKRPNVVDICNILYKEVLLLDSLSEKFRIDLVFDSALLLCKSPHFSSYIYSFETMIIGVNHVKHILSIAFRRRNHYRVELCGL